MLAQNCPKGQRSLSGGSKMIEQTLKAKVVRRGDGGFEGVTTPAPPSPAENFNHTFIGMASRTFFTNKCTNLNESACRNGRNR